MKSTSPVKARKMYVGQDTEMACSYKDSLYTIPVAVLSLSPAASEARIEAGAKALSKKMVPHLPWKHLWPDIQERHRDYVRAIVSTLGLLASAKEKGKKL